MNVNVKAGFSRCDITPTESVPLAGYGDTKGRMHTCVLDPLYATCVALFDGENTALFYHMDLTGCHTQVFAECKKRLVETYGLKKEFIFFTATHTHSAPDLNSELECITRYKSEVLIPNVVAVAKDAIADLEDAELFAGSGKTDGLNFVRRYLLSDGSYGGDNFGDFKKNEILAHETDADPTMQVLRWKRLVGKDIVMANWQAHPHRTGGFRKFDLSSDVIEHFRKNVEATNKYLFAYYQGCSGNLNTNSRLPSENLYRTPDYYEEGSHHGYRTHGRCLAETCLSILDHNMRKLKTGKLLATSSVFEHAVNHAFDDKVDLANEVWELWNASKNDEAKALAKEYGFNSVYHCSAVINRSQMPATFSYEIYAISCGDFALVGTPNEIYDTTGMYLKNVSPFETTFICGYTNGHGCGYMPTVKAFAHGGYGCDTCRFPSGAAEKLADAILALLVELYEAK